MKKSRIDTKTPNFDPVNWNAMLSCELALKPFIMAINQYIAGSKKCTMDKLSDDKHFQDQLEGENIPDYIEKSKTIATNKLSKNKLADLTKGKEKIEDWAKKLKYFEGFYNSVLYNSLTKCGRY